MFSVLSILTRVFLFYFYRSLSGNTIHSLPPGIFFNLTKLKKLYVCLRFSLLLFTQGPFYNDSVISFT